MKYMGRDVEVISKRTIFGKTIAEIRILATSQILNVAIDELHEDKSEITSHEIVFKVIAAKIKSELLNQNILAPFESNIIPLPHQILALEKVMSGQFL